MIQEQDLPKVNTPSKKAILKATVVALFIAVVVLFTTILPAEYGIDPLRTGAAFGLIELSDATEAQAAPANPPAANATVTNQTTGYKVDSEELLLVPGQGVEIKYHMAKGATMVYSWKASG